MSYPSNTKGGMCFVLAAHVSLELKRSTIQQCEQWFNGRHWERGKRETKTWGVVEGVCCVP
eukprot:107094-Amorphochlora_amoeboformis.AAC.1